MSPRILITTVPFGAIDPRPAQLLRLTGWDFVVNPLGRRLKEEELVEMVGDFDGLVAGTEPITERVMAAGKCLKMIARVGIGLDNVDLSAARKRGIQVSYTPDAPAPAVAELTVGLMLDLLRGVSGADRKMRAGTWERYQGKRLSNCVVGVVGAGRVGRRVIRHLAGFAPRILANDLAPDKTAIADASIRWTDKEEIYAKADIITFHVPLTPLTRHLVTARELAQMRPGVFLVNTARGGILHEKDLAEALAGDHLGGAAIDVFEQEPYQGPLQKAERALLTCHMGSCTEDCRAQMEIEATQDLIRFFKGEPLQSPVPETEYELRDQDVRYVVRSVSNKNIHLLAGSDTSASDNRRYQDYRRRWHENPSLFKVDPFPLHLDLEVTDCPARGDSAKHGFLNRELARRIFEEGAREGLCAVKFNYRGEPLCHPELTTFVEMAQAAGILDIYFQTEGTLLTAEVADRLVTAGLTRISILIGGRTGERVSADEIGEIVENLGRLRWARERQGGGKPLVRIQTYFAPEQKAEMDRFARLWSPHGDEVAYLTPLPETPLQDAAQDHVEWACPMPWQRLLITWDGEARFCECGGKEARLGTVQEMSIKELWQGTKIQALRETHRAGQCHKDAICGRCLFRGGMMGRAAL